MERTEQDEVMHFLKVIHIQMEETANSLMKHYDLTAAQWDVLGFILEHEDTKINSTMLHQQTHLSKANISVLLKKLRNKGFLQFELNPKDDRQKQIVVTKKTKEIEKKLRSDLCELQEDLFEEISKEEVFHMVHFLKKILIRLQRVQERRQDR